MALSMRKRSKSEPAAGPQRHRDRALVVEPGQVARVAAPTAAELLEHRAQPSAHEAY